MAKVYANYPHGLSDKQLVEAIQEYATTINSSGVNINTVLQFSPYISLGLNELQSRQNKRITRISIGVGIVSLTVAAVALYISLDSGRSSDVSSARQIVLLEELNKNISENQKIVTELIKAQRGIPEKKPAANPAVKWDAPKAARPLP